MKPLSCAGCADCAGNRKITENSKNKIGRMNFFNPNGLCASFKTTRGGCYLPMVCNLSPATAQK
jgi:hypothetical protein